MSGCGGKIGGSIGGGDPVITGTNNSPFCPDISSDSSNWIPIGGRVRADNGVSVEVVAIFAHPEEPEETIVCLDYYLNDQKLSDQPVCITNGTTVKIGDVICPQRFTDYGVRLFHGQPFDMAIPLKAEATTAPLKNTADLFNACLEAGEKAHDCLRYVVRDPLPYEEVINEGGYATFYPVDQEKIGTYFAAQWPLCRAHMQDQLVPAAPIPPQGHLRLYVDEELIMGVGGKALPGNNAIVFLETGRIPSLEANLEKYVEAPTDKCIDPVLFHEAGHLIIMNYGDAFGFWMPLQEGMMRFLEWGEDPHYPTPLVYEDKIVILNESISLAIPREDGESSQYTIGLFLANPPDEPVLSVTKEGWLGQSYSVEGYTMIPLSDSYYLLVDPPALSVAEPAARIRLINLDLNATQNSQAMLACGENTYQLFAGFRLDGQFYVIDPTVAFVPTEQGAVDYRPLDGSLSVEKTYNSGACFFHKIAEAYVVAGKDFATFYPQLIVAFHSYTQQALALQFAEPFCALPEMQKILDSDLGPGAFDVTELAIQYFAYDPDKPWCASPRVLSGTADRFGSSIFSF